VTVLAAGWPSFCDRRGLTVEGVIASGFDFVVLKVTDRQGRPLAARLPRGGRFSSDVNDPHVDRQVLLVQEYELTRHLAAHGLPVARPVELVRDDGLDVLLVDYLPDDGRGVDSVALGRTLARLHALPPPDVPLVAAEGLPAGAMVTRRIARRWAELGRLAPGLPPLPDAAARQPPVRGRSLLHLDVRAANLRCVDGRPALVDWANSLAGDPGLELARITEFASMPANGIELAGLLRGYGPAAAELRAAPAFPLYLLDAALMLALVFTGEAPDPVLGPVWVRRAVDRAAALAARNDPGDR
jgi:aminoglycoside phosphotransferase (APT) family kinase protein